MARPTLGQVVEAIPGLKQQLEDVLKWMADGIKGVVPEAAAVVDAKRDEALANLAAGLSQEIAGTALAEAAQQLVELARDGEGEAPPSVADGA